jgi:hypothetical protein
MFKDEKMAFLLPGFQGSSGMAAYSKICDFFDP